ncbi:amidohydrolase [Streptomyces albofaciens JCM 4342]|uniref:amidohydrolase n=1 Tax=Streptomyces albofaciens TaxID=66866 RepID=UPI0012399E01|nr:amidohydrolase [Streptomyces albofaciens]KAA6223203.1 amidohydrolase [Streptomyces albofaciens JCM 4342]
MTDPRTDELRAEVTAALPAALELYLRLHSDPELSGAERRTAAAVAAALRNRGCAVTEGVGGHGVVGVLGDGTGPNVLLRAELDALPVREETGLPYASRTDGVMHACGHDAHLAAAVGAMDVLARLRERWRGTVTVVAQPAEETLTGAEAVLADGLYERFGTPDTVLAQHLAPFPAARVAHAETVLAAARTLRVVLHGPGGHSADPAGAANPVEAAAAVVTGLRAAVGADASAAVGVLHAGTAANVVPDRATLEVSVRAGTAAAAERAAGAVRELACAQAARLLPGHPPEVEVTARAEPTVNDPRWLATVRRAHAAALGPAAVLPWRPSMAAEDFPRYTAGGAIPAVYWMLGCVGREEWRQARAEAPGREFTVLPPNHSPRFAPAAVPTLRTGITAMAGAALACLVGVSEL